MPNMKLLLSVVLMAALAGSIEARADSPQRIDVLAGDLVVALKSLARQTDVELVFQAKELQGLRTQGVRGTYVLKDAMAELLKGTSLTFHLDASGAMLIQPKPGGNATSDVSPADQMRVTMMVGEPGAEATKSAELRKDTVVVEDKRIKPWTDANVDIPRTIDDAQPYYILDATAIERSGASSIEDFLKQRLTMNTTAGTSRQSPNSLAGNSSRVNLRGFGTEQTLILVNGRRMPNVYLQGSSFQPDINGIPLSAVDRIEVLPSSASGIYGGNSLGGVINVVLKEDYKGGEFSVSYQNTLDTDAPYRTASVTFGSPFEGGRSRLMVSAQYSDSGVLLLRDREALVSRGYDFIIKNNPAFLYGLPVPVLGANLNIGTLGGVDLTLKGSGVSLNSAIATLPAGYSETSSPSTIIAGQWDYTPADVNQTPSGRLLPLEAGPQTRSFMATFRRDMTDWLELDVEASQTSNQAVGSFTPISYLNFISATNPRNPFNQSVLVSIPFSIQAPIRTESLTQSATVGAILALPHRWAARADATYSRNRFGLSWHSFDPVYNTDLFTGAINPFVDQKLYPVDVERYISSLTQVGRTYTRDSAIRVSGPIALLSWITPHFTAALQYRKEGIGDSSETHILPITTTDNYTSHSPRSSQSDLSYYAELGVPLVSAAADVSFVKELEAQLAVRVDRYTVRNPGETATARYESVNPTLGLKWRPVDAVVLRASYATAFLPPSFAQLSEPLTPDPRSASVYDPVQAATYSVSVFSGGNADLKPHNSRSLNAGVVVESGSRSWGELRLSADYYDIVQTDKIGALSAQTLINMESSFPDRITRDAVTGLITAVDGRLLNLTRDETRGIDVAATFRRAAAIGSIEFSALATRILSFDRQAAVTSPLADYLGWVNRSGPGKIKANFTVSLERNGWLANWSARYFGSYNQNGASGDPVGASPGTILAQGSTTIPSQHYHDLFVSYSYRASQPQAGAGLIGRVMSGMTVKVGILNVFDQLPPVDVNNAGLYASYFGDKRLREYVISLRRQF